MPTIPMYLRNADNDETVFCTVRLNKEKKEALRSFMNSPAEEKDIHFPFHVRMVRVGFGWYRLISDREFRAGDGVRNAMKAIRLFYKKFREDEAAEQMRLALMKQGAVTIAYSSEQDAYTTITTAPESSSEETPEYDLEHLLKFQELADHHNSGDLPLPDCQPPYTLEELLSAPNLSKEEKKLWKILGLGPRKKEPKLNFRLKKKNKSSKTAEAHLRDEVGQLVYDSLRHHHAQIRKKNKYRLSGVPEFDQMI